MTDVPGRPPGVTHGDAAYWARIRRLVAQAPPLNLQQQAVIRAAFYQPTDQKERAA
ncbi:hypothetical protein [Streptomyces brevispora]|uniref:Uncharacterized protein n=1 Tax=Streptomyces brevispora TaxID=887462 RepID=A0ABZ1G4W0_9ACTN|nr:hypothetical protein [Streptomyces brevispora]WSC14936.1 hypothetical protein OIE64_20230 [Streptomyces brevispora]